MINISHLSFHYPQTTVPVLDNVSLSIEPGTLTLVAGASGSGKSTFLQCINGLVPHFSGGRIEGTIDVFGMNPIQSGLDVLSNTVGFVFQEPEAQFVFDTVEDEIAFALENQGISRKEMHYRVDSILDIMGLTLLRDQKIQDLSGGEKQKIAITSALILRPEVLVLDEPTSQLDPTSADEILRLIVDLKVDHNLTVLISEHRLERLLPYTDNILFLTMEHGFMFGTPQEILPKMEHVPPIITIAKRLNLFPLPLAPSDFPANDRDPLSGQAIPSDSSVPYKSSRESIHLDHLSVQLQGNEILKDISFTLNQGEILALLGPNGAGKTTLLRAVLGLIPSDGRRNLQSMNMAEMTLSDIIEHIGYLPQNPNDLLFSDSVLGEMQMTLKNHHLLKEDDEIASFLTLFGLQDRQNDYPRDLSVGERQRVALAAITVHDPQILFLDEPTRGLDYRAKIDLANLLREWRDQGKSILLVTHDVEFAADFADRVAILEEGSILFTGHPKIAFSQFEPYLTQTAKIFPGRNWITPQDIPHTSN